MWHLVRLTCTLLAVGVSTVFLLWAVASLLFAMRTSKAHLRRDWSVGRDVK